MDKTQLLDFHGEPTLDSREVAKMIGKRHRDLMRDIRRYISDMDEGAKLRSPKFFIESNYESSQGKLLPCYLLTKMGCEFVANKMTGKKGTLGGARNERKNSYANFCKNIFGQTDYCCTV